jgi:predicted glutamine amidotransferase
MCGIFGMISRKAKPFNKRAFCTMGVRNDSRGGDSCGVFIDGLVEYGVDKQKTFISFFRDSLILDTTTECKVALGHCRKASVGKVSIETAQPVVLYNEQNEVDYVLIHNGTIYNYKELAKKYIPDIDIDGLTDSQVMARIFYYKGYDCLDEYIGGAVFVIHDYRVNKSLVFKGHSKKYTYSANVEEERPLFYCWHNGRFVFSSIFETLYAFYYDETVYSLPFNKLMVVRGDKLKLVKEYKREKATQSKPTTVVTTGTGGVIRWDDDDEVYPRHYGTHYTNDQYLSYKIKYDGVQYTNDRKEPMHGVFRISSYGYVFPNRKEKENWLEEVAFFKGQMLKHPKAFALINSKYTAANNQITPDIETLINMLNFNPHSEDCVQYYWYDGDTLMVPTGEWKWPMADWSIVFDGEGKATKYDKSPYTGWTTDYKMYTYEEDKILEAWSKICGAV